MVTTIDVTAKRTSPADDKISSHVMSNFLSIFPFCGKLHEARERQQVRDETREDILDGVVEHISMTIDK